MLLSRVSVAVVLALFPFSVVFGQRIRSRLEGQTVSTTSECNNLRQQSFYAQLDLFYFYLIEYETDMTLDLSNIERAVAMALLDTVKFRQCDESDQPQFGILLVQSAHQFATSSKYWPGDYWKLVQRNTTDAHLADRLKKTGFAMQSFHKGRNAESFAGKRRFCSTRT